MMASGTYTLGTLLDWALGTPEIGAVNFNILHRLLRAVLNRLDISEHKVRVDGSDFQWPLSTAADYASLAGSPPKQAKGLTLKCCARYQKGTVSPFEGSPFPAFGQGPESKRDRVYGYG